MRSATNIRTGLTAGEIKQAFRDNLCCGLGQAGRRCDETRSLRCARADCARSALERTVEELQTYGGADAPTVAYLSAEFLPGPHLANNLLNLGITEVTREALRELGYKLDEILAQEEEPGLGNGGLGRLARRVTWILSRPSKCQPLVTVSATSSASSIKPSGTVGSMRSLISGYVPETRGRSRVRRLVMR